LDVGSKDNLVRALLAAKELERRKTECPLAFWRPHKIQKAALEAALKHRIVVMDGGNRVGKSDLAAATAVSCMYGYRIFEVPGLALTENGDYPARDSISPQYWIRRVDGVPLRFPSRCVLLTGQSMRLGILENLWPKIRKFLPPRVLGMDGFELPKGPGGTPLHLALPNGSRLIFGSVEQKPDVFEGVDLDAAIFDEFPSPAFWTPIWRGLTDRRGSVLIAATPWGENALPFYRAVLANRDPAIRAHICEIKGSSWDNPYLTREAIEEYFLLGNMGEEERQAREHGKWTGGSLSAFPQFDTSVHVVPAETPVPDGWARIVVCDPAHRRPFAFLWMAFEPVENGRILLYDEWPETEHHEMRSSPYTIKEYVQMIRQKENGHPMAGRFLDPRFGKAEHSVKGAKVTSIQEDFMAAGLYFDCQIEGTEREETGILRLRELLAYDKRAPLSVLNCPKLQIRANCINSILAFADSIFMPPSARAKDELPDTLHERYKDFRDCARYGVLANFPLVMSTKASGYINEDDWNSQNDEME
jgi:hypothetical protein